MRYIYVCLTSLITACPPSLSSSSKAPPAGPRPPSPGSCVRTAGAIVDSASSPVDVSPAKNWVALAKLPSQAYRARHACLGASSSVVASHRSTSGHDIHPLPAPSKRLGIADHPRLYMPTVHLITSSCQYNNINTHVRGRGPVYSVTTPILYSIGWSIVIKCPRQGRIVLWGMYSIMLCVCKMELYYYTMGPRIVQSL